MTDDRPEARESAVQGELKVRWGDEEYAHKMSDAREALDNVGLEDLEALEQEVGERGLLQGAAELGKYSRAGALDPELKLNSIRAHARLGVLKTDREFGERLARGDVAAKDEWRELHQVAYPAELDPPTDS